MAGPGGGPPRRSHTKSRKGCDNCKRRHIRCDESFPQCLNCTKHKVRCPYHDMPVPDEKSGSPDKPDLMWSEEIERAILEWRRTGIFPFPSLDLYPAPEPQYFSTEDLRLIYHVAIICHELGNIEANGFTLWTRHIPTILKIGVGNRYVMHALLAFSAMHIAFLTNCPMVGNMAYEHKGAALSGLKEAIGSFSRDNSDAILAASLVLSWQATDWRSWTQLMQGTRTVMGAMEPWQQDSQFGEFIAESSTFPTAPPSPRPDQQPLQPAREDLEAFQRTISQLAKVEAHQKQSREDPKLVQQLASFLKGARKVSPTQSVSEQFDRLQPLRTWLFWLPVLCLQQNGTSPSALVIIAHYYTAAILMERLFPDIGAAYFGSLSVKPVEEIARRLMSFNVSGRLEGDMQTPLTLMEFPVDVVNEFRNRMGWCQPPRTPSFPQFDPPNFGMNEGGPHGTPSSATSYPPYAEHSNFSWSTEDLSLLAPPPARRERVNAPSPLMLSSPFSCQSQQFLSIPSPLYGAGYSPVSSTFGGEGSVAFSDTEEYYDAGYSAYPPLSARSTYGDGTPSNPNFASSSVSVSSPAYYHDQPGPILSPQPMHFAPSPFLRPDPYPDYPESTTPLSLSAPSAQFAPETWQHHGHPSSPPSQQQHIKHEDEDEQAPTNLEYLQQEDGTSG